MAQAWAKKLYNSKAWLEVRQAVMKRQSYKCFDCGRAAEEVHHKIVLTEDNVNDPNIALSMSNLVALCYNCHRKRHEEEFDKVKIESYEFDEDGNLLPPGGCQNKRL